MPTPACLFVCLWVSSSFVCDLAPAHSRRISSPISRPTSQENRWSLLTEVLLLWSAANNAALSVCHSGRFTPLFSRWSLLYQHGHGGTGRVLRAYIVHVGFVGHSWFTRMLWGGLWHVQRIAFIEQQQFHYWAIYRLVYENIKSNWCDISYLVFRMGG